MILELTSSKHDICFHETFMGGNKQDVIVAYVTMATYSVEDVIVAHITMVTYSVVPQGIQKL